MQIGSRAEAGIFGHQLLRFRTRILEQGQIARKFGQTDGRQPGLLGAEQIARTAQLEIRFGDAESVRGFFQNHQSIEFFLGIFAREQNAPRFLRSASDAPAQLVQLGQTEPFRVLHQQDGGIGHVDAYLDNRGANQCTDFPAAKIGHDGFLLFGLQSSVEQRAAVRCEQRLPFLEFRGRCFQFLAFALLDHRVNEISLTSFIELLAQKIRCLGKFLVRTHQGLDWRPPRGHFVEHGQFEIAVKRQRESARNGRCRHDQHMRMRFLGRECGSLFDAELVLFVDDHERRMAHGVRGEQKRVRADDHPRSAGGCFFFAGRGAQRNWDAQWLEQATQIFVMLMGEDLGRRHERGGMTRGQGADHGGCRHNGFSAAHVAVEQAIHRLSACQVVEDLSEHALLRGGQRKGELFDELGEKFRVAPDDRCGAG